MSAARLHVLHVEGEPRFEVKFLRRALQRDETIRLISLVRTAENKFYRLGVDSPTALKDGFPSSREELFKYDVIVFGSVPASMLTPAQSQWVAGFASRRGVGVVDDIKPGARLLWQGHADGTAQAMVILAEQDYGEGHVAALPVRDLWRWQMDKSIALEDLTHEYFWQQWLRWMARSARTQAQVSVATPTVAVGTDVEIITRVLDETYTPHADARAKLTVITPNGERKVLSIAALDGTDAGAGQFVADSSGVYEVELQVARDDDTVSVSRAFVEAQEYGREMFSPQRNDTQLHNIASICVPTNLSAQEFAVRDWRAQLQLGKARQVIVSTRKQIEQNPNDGELWLLLGDALTQSGAPAEAALALQRASEVSATVRARANAGLAKLSLLDADPDLAERFAQTALGPIAKDLSKVSAPELRGAARAAAVLGRENSRLLRKAVDYFLAAIDKAPQRQRRTHGPSSIAAVALQQHRSHRLCSPSGRTVTN